jgi:tetratricopeptide (TPR) repeat protein
VSKKKHKHLNSAVTKSPAANRQNGLRAFRQNDFTTAIRLWSQVDLQNDSVMRAALTEAHFRRAVNTADSPSCLTDLQRALELSPAEGRFWYHLGMAHHRADRLDEALAAYSRAIECGDQRAARLRALATIERDAQASLKGLAEADRDAWLPVALLLRGDLHAVLDRPVASGQTPAAANLWHGLAALATNDFVAARNRLLPQGKSLRAGVESVRAYYHGLAVWAAGDRDTAINEWRTAAARTPTPRLLAIVSAEQAQQLNTLLSNEQWEVALLTAQAALRLTPDQPELLNAQLIALHRLALAAQQRSDWPAAIQHWQMLANVLGEQPQLGVITPALHNLALAYEKNDRWAEAAATWDELRGLLPSRPSAKSQAALQLPLPVPEFRAWLRRHVLECYKHTGDLNSAITQYRALIKSNPDDLDLRYEFADALISNAQEIAARNEVQRILEKDEKRTAARLLLVEIHLERGELYAAEMQARQALELDPSHAAARQALSDVLAERGHNLFEMSRFAEAKKFYDEALALTPDHSQLLIWLGNTELVLRNQPEAVRYFDRALSKATDLHVYVSVFECWALRDDLDNARALISRAQAAGFATAHFYVDLADICLAQSAPPLPAFFGPPSKPKKSAANPWEQLGREMLRQAEAVSDDVAQTLREIVSGVGRTHPELAIEYGQRLIKLTPNDPMAWIVLAVIQAMAGQIKPAKDTARQAASLARKQNNPQLARDIDALRQELDMPIPFMGADLFGDDDFDDEFDDEELF